MRAQASAVRRGLRLLALRLTMRLAWDRGFSGLAIGGVLGAAAAAIARAGLPEPSWLPAAFFAVGAAIGAAAGLARPVALSEAAAFADARVPGADGLFGAALETGVRPEWGAFGPRIAKAADRAWADRGESLRIAFLPPPAALASAVLAAMCGGLAFLPASEAHANGRAAVAARILRGAAAGNLPKDLREALQRGIASLEAGTLSEEERQQLLDQAIAAGLPDVVTSRIAWALAQAGEHASGGESPKKPEAIDRAEGNATTRHPVVSVVSRPDGSMEALQSIPPHLREFVTNYYRIRDGLSKNR